MDLFNEKAFYADVVSPAISRLNQETVPALRNGVEGIVQQLFDRLKLELARSLQQIESTCKSTVDNVQTSIRSLDGANLSMESFSIQITVPALTIKLQVPPGDAH